MALLRVGEVEGIIGRDVESVNVGYSKRFGKCFNVLENIVIHAQNHLNHFFGF